MAGAQVAPRVRRPAGPFATICGVMAVLALAFTGMAAAVPPPVAERGTATIGFLSTQARHTRPTPGPLEASIAHHGGARPRLVSYEYRFADGIEARLPALAADLVARRPAVIVCLDYLSARAAAAATDTIPIVFIAHVDPLQHRFLSSLRSSNRNLTGVVTFRPVVVKLAEVALDAIAGARQVVALLDLSELSSLEAVEPMRDLVRRRGAELVVHDISSTEKLFRYLDGAQSVPSSVLVVPASTASWQNRARLVKRLGELRAPTIYEADVFVSAGGLMSYGPSFVDVVPRAAQYVNRVLAGEHPSTLPILQPTKLELVVNLKAARRQGITLARPFLQRADRIVE